MSNLYKELAKQWKKGDKFKTEMIEWRKQNTVHRIDAPSRLDRARALGYKAKTGFVIVRVKIKKGARRRRLYHRKARKPSKSGLVRFGPKSMRWIAEGRAVKKYVNMSVLNSYLAAQDGKNKYFEVILVDSNNPNISNDPNLKWISAPANKRRVFHGLTASGKRSRGLK